MYGIDFRPGRLVVCTSEDKTDSCKSAVLPGEDTSMGWCGGGDGEVGGGCLGGGRGEARGGGSVSLSC